jgi:alginate O-acetyltransferase complex protein AlgI
MLFNSLEFLIFFAIVCILYFSLPDRFRWMLLLVGSYAFYISWEADYAILLAGLTLFNYSAALLLDRTTASGRKKVVLALTLLSNVGVLFWLKYLNFFAGSAKNIFHHYNIAVTVPVFSVILPVGISFYTFKIMNYIIDVYRGAIQPEKKLGIFALFVSFFPQLIAGPIDRATSLLPQFHGSHDFDYQRVTSGLKLMLWGFFQKLVIADNLSVIVDRVFNHPRQHEGLSLLLASILFTFQIYCDFSGYSDIAIGAARVFGFTSMNNFERPYFSGSIPEFWRRWHISLSSWFRDYLYIPLGGNRVAVPRWYLNLFIVFIVSGLWHGANWTFIVWGALHGFLCILSAATGNLRKRLTAAVGLGRTPALHQVMRVVMTFLLVSLAWIFFRANTISDALYVVSHLFTGWFDLSGKGGIPSVYALISSCRFEFIVGSLSVVIMEIVHFMQQKRSVRQMVQTKPIWQRWALYYCLVAAILLLGNLGSKQFIYFQF